MGAMNNQSGNLPDIRRTEVVQLAPMTKLVPDKEFIGNFRAADTTPSVLNLTKFMAGNVGANNVTYFDDGYDGQEVSVVGDGFTTIVHDTTKIATNTAANKLLVTFKVYRFTRYTLGGNKVWVEDA